MSAFDACFTIVVGTEGGYTQNPQDPGNWTGGKVHVGQLRGTKYGISAAAYPKIDIANLTTDQAKAIYQADYWSKIAGDQLPGPLALLVFDAAVNNSPGRAAQWLQTALGVAADGAIGPDTLTALQRSQTAGADLCAAVLAQRIEFMAGLPTWKVFAGGWSKRLAALPYQSLAIGA